MSGGAGVNIFTFWGWLDYINGVTGTPRTFAQAGAYTDSWGDFQAYMPRWNFQQWFVNEYIFDAQGTSPLVSGFYFDVRLTRTMLRPPAAPATATLATLTTNPTRAPRP